MDSEGRGGQTACKATRREWSGLVVISLTCLLCAMDSTVLHLAVPDISVDLRPTSSQLLWIVDIYGFVLAGLLLTMGSLGDRIGHRRLLLMGAAAFGAASILASLASNAMTLIAARALLGIAGATLAPSTLSLIRHMFHDTAQRSLAIAVWTASFSIGGAVGPLLGGVILQHFGWGAVFLVAIPIILGVLALGPALLPESVNPNAGPLDLTSALQSIVGVLLIVFGFKLLAVDGWGWPVALATAAGAIVSAVFIRRQRGLKQPLIDLGLLRNRTFVVLLLAYTLGCFVTYGVSLFTAQYLQLVLGLSPFEAGLWTSPRVIGFLLGSLLASVVVRRFEQRHLMSAGLVIASIGLAMITQMEQRSGVELLASSLFVLSFGLAITFVPAIALLIGSAPPERAGQASGMSETGSEFGGALGVAILGGAGLGLYRHILIEKLPRGISSEDMADAGETLGGAFATAQRLPEGIGSALLDAARAAFETSLHFTALVAGIITLALAIMIWRLRHIHAASASTAELEDRTRRLSESSGPQQS